MASEEGDGRILTEEADGVGWVIFDNPRHLNAFTPQMVVDFDQAIERFEADAAIKVVVLRGAGDHAFSAGGDLKGDREAQQRVRSRRQDFLPTITKPVLAMIHGVCIGHALAVAVEADLRIAADDARFAIPVARLGFAYPYEVVSRIVALVGPASASMLSFTADTINAGEALQIGLVDRVVKKADLEVTLRDLARRIAQRAPLSVRASKMTIRAITSGRQEDMDRSWAMIAACKTSDDAVEGRAAFVQKRPPRFKGR